MALTVVRDEQLKLDSVDQTVKLLNAALALELRNSSPELRVRDTDVAANLGLHRIRGLNDEIRFEHNLGASEDFATLNNLLRLGSNVTVAVKGRLKLENLAAGGLFGALGASLQFVESTTFADVPSSTSMFLSSTDNRLHVRDAAGFEQTIVWRGDFVIRETPAGVLNGVNTTFTLANTPVTGSEEVYLNGILQEPGGTDDYTISGLTITYNTAPISTDRLRVSYIKT